MQTSNNVYKESGIKHVKKIIGLNLDRIDWMILELTFPL